MVLMGVIDLRMGREGAGGLISDPDWVALLCCECV